MKKKVFREKYYGKPVVEEVKEVKPKKKTKKGDK